MSGVGKRDRVKLYLSCFDVINYAATNFLKLENCLFEYFVNVHLAYKAYFYSLHLAIVTFYVIFMSFISFLCNLPVFFDYKLFVFVMMI